MGCDGIKKSIHIDIYLPLIGKMNGKSKEKCGTSLTGWAPIN